MAIGLGSRRAVRLGNRPHRSLVTKAAEGRRAIRQAVTCKRRAGLENVIVDADPPLTRGRLQRTGKVIDACTRPVRRVEDAPSARGNGDSMPEKGLWATGEVQCVGIATRTPRQGADNLDVGGGHGTDEAG